MSSNTFALLDQIGIPYLTADGQRAHGSLADQLAQDVPVEMAEPIAIPCPWDNYRTMFWNTAAGLPALASPENLRYVITGLHGPDPRQQAPVGVWWSFAPQGAADSCTITIERYVYPSAPTWTTIHTVTVSGGPSVGHWWIDDTTWGHMYDGAGQQASIRVTVTGTAGRVSLRKLYIPQGVLVRVSGSDTGADPTPRCPQAWQDQETGLLPLTGSRDLGSVYRAVPGVDQRRSSNPGCSGNGWPSLRGRAGSVAISSGAVIEYDGGMSWPGPWYATLPCWHDARRAGIEAATFPRLWNGSQFHDYIGFTDSLGIPSCGSWVPAGTVAPEGIGYVQAAVAGIPADYNAESSATYTITDTLTSTVVGSGSLYYDGDIWAPNLASGQLVALTAPTEGTVQRLRLDITSTTPSNPMTGTMQAFPTFAPPPWAVPCVDGTIIKGRQVAGWKVAVATASLPAGVADAAPGDLTVSGLSSSVRRCRFWPAAGWYTSTYGALGEFDLRRFLTADTVDQASSDGPATGGDAPFWVNTGGAATCTITPSTITRPDLTVGAPVLGSAFRRFVAPAAGSYLFTFRGQTHRERWRAFLSRTDPNCIQYEAVATARASRLVDVTGLATAPPAPGWWGSRAYAIADAPTGDWAALAGQYASAYGLGSVYQWGYEPAQDGDVLRIAGSYAYQRRDGLWESTPETVTLQATMAAGETVYLRGGYVAMLGQFVAMDPLGHSFGGSSQLYIGVTAA